MMNMEEKMDRMLQMMGGLQSDVLELKTDVAEIKADMADLKPMVAKVESKVTAIELSLEMVTNRNILTIVDGHLDLSRKLSDAIRAQDYIEMTKVRVNILEEDVRKLKKAVAI